MKGITVSKEFKIFVSVLLGLCVAALVATDDPDTGAQGISNPWALITIAVFTALATLRALKKLRV
jgi:hypothetical protein